ncbi:MAG: 50S ribosomal protein L31 [Leptospiraceae bacterium]|nr:50S ribosomal protein L31 [Leptospiraceae bacterium]MCP5495386.1 50S ribosomal protein L31 [Leptospiraceae bacterium]
MKKGIHPDYKKAMIKCSCGNVIETRTTRGDLLIEICSNCHPFFTGKSKLIDTTGRVDKFKKKYKMK